MWINNLSTLNRGTHFIATLNFLKKEMIPSLEEIKRITLRCTTGTKGKRALQLHPRWLCNTSECTHTKKPVSEKTDTVKNWKCPDEECVYHVPLCQHPTW